MLRESRDQAARAEATVLVNSTGARERLPDRGAGGDGVRGARRREGGGDG